MINLSEQIYKDLQEKATYLGITVESYIENLHKDSKTFKLHMTGESEAFKEFISEYLDVMEEMKLLRPAFLKTLNAADIDPKLIAVFEEELALLLKQDARFISLMYQKYKEKKEHDQL